MTASATGTAADPAAASPVAPVAGRVIGLLIAAGHGRRFDPTGRRSKLEQPVDGEWVAVRTARALAAGCDAVIAVLRPESTALATALGSIGCRVVAVTGPEGMGTSIACGARAALAETGCTQVLVQPADMPWISAATVLQIAQTPSGLQSIVVPVFQGRDGHPVRFDRRHLPDLAALGGERGARPLLERHAPLRIPVDDPGVIRDLDTPADLALPGIRPADRLAD